LNFCLTLSKNSVIYFSKRNTVDGAALRCWHERRNVTSSGATTQKITAKLIKAPGRVVGVGKNLTTTNRSTFDDRSILTVQALLPFEEHASSDLVVFNDLEKHLCFTLYSPPPLSLIHSLSFDRSLFPRDVLVPLLVTRLPIWFTNISRFFRDVQIGDFRIKQRERKL